MRKRDKMNEKMKRECMMRRLFLSTLLIFALLLCGCWGEKVEGEGAGQEEMSSAEQGEIAETASETLPEIPNEPEDGYSKRY